MGTYIAILNGCDYAQSHHGHNFTWLNADDEQSAQILRSLRADKLMECGDSREVAALRYARKLCLQPESMGKSDVDAMRSAGWSDGELLEIVQVVAMFSYFVRVINGVGIQMGDEKPGLY